MVDVSHHLTFNKGDRPPQREWASPSQLKEGDILPQDFSLSLSLGFQPIGLSCRFQTSQLPIT